MSVVADAAPAVDLEQVVPGPKLSFDRDLRHVFTPLTERLQKGMVFIDDLLELIKERISLDVDTVERMNKMLSTVEERVSEKRFSEIGSIGRAVNAITNDLRNQCVARTEFVNSLSEDIYKPLSQLREVYVQNNRRFAATTKSAMSEFRKSRSRWFKVKVKYDKLIADTADARQNLVNAKMADPDMSASQVLKLGQKVNAAMKATQKMQPRYDDARRVWMAEQVKFDDEMTSVLQGMQSNEALRLQTCADSLRKWGVGITNECANRNYDIQNMTEIMSAVDPDCDMQTYIKETLEQYPPKIFGGAGGPSSPGDHPPSVARMMSVEHSMSESDKLHVPTASGSDWIERLGGKRVSMSFSFPSIGKRERGSFSSTTPASTTHHTTHTRSGSIDTSMIDKEMAIVHERVRSDQEEYGLSRRRSREQQSPQHGRRRSEEGIVAASSAAAAITLTHTFSASPSASAVSTAEPSLSSVAARKSTRTRQSAVVNDDALSSDSEDSGHRGAGDALDISYDERKMELDGRVGHAEGGSCSASSEDDEPETDVLDAPPPPVSRAKSTESRFVPKPRPIFDALPTPPKQGH